MNTQFKTILDAVAVEVEFDGDFHNGTGYFDDFCFPPGSEGVQVVKCKSDDGRWILAIKVRDHKDREGVLVVHERYVGHDDVTFTTIGRANMAVFPPRLASEDFTNLALLVAGMPVTRKWTQRIGEATRTSIRMLVRADVEVPADQRPRLTPEEAYYEAAVRLRRGLADVASALLVNTCNVRHRGFQKSDAEHLCDVADQLGQLALDLERDRQGEENDAAQA